MAGPRKPIRVLIAEDSAFLRKLLRSLLSADPEIQVVGEAADGRQAIALATRLRPQVIALDILLPGVDGLAVTQQILALHPRPIVILSSGSEQAAAATLQALEAGAVDFWIQPSGAAVVDMDRLQQELARKLKRAARRKPSRGPRRARRKLPPAAVPSLPVRHVPEPVRGARPEDAGAWPEASSAAAAPTGTPAARQILLVESNIFFAVQWGDALLQQGFDVVHSSTPEDAAGLLNWLRPAAVLCADPQQVRTLAGIVHREGESSRVPIIALGSGEKHSLLEALRAGCDDFLDRRLSPETIAAHVRSFLERQDAGTQPTLSGSLPYLGGSLPPRDLPAVLQMLAHSRQSGALHVQAGEAEGVIFLIQGEIVHAETRDLIGDDAVLSLVKASAGREDALFKFVPGAAAIRTVTRSVTELMLEALREVDEQARAVKTDAK